MAWLFMKGVTPAKGMRIKIVKSLYHLKPIPQSTHQHDNDMRTIAIKM